MPSNIFLKILCRNVCYSNLLSQLGLHHNSWLVAAGRWVMVYYCCSHLLSSYSVLFSYSFSVYSSSVLSSC